MSGTPVTVTLNRPAGLNYPGELNATVLTSGVASMTPARPVYTIALPLNNTAPLNHRAGLNATAMSSGVATMTGDRHV